MLKWNANFQIPNSGVQAQVVYAFASIVDGVCVVDFYGEPNKTALLYTKQYDIPEDVKDIETYLLTLEEFKVYERT